MNSEVMEELYQVKQSIAAQYKTFAEFAQDLLRKQAEAKVKMPTLQWA